MPDSEEIKLNGPYSEEVSRSFADKHDAGPSQIRKNSKSSERFSWWFFVVLVLTTIGVYLPILNSGLIWSPYDSVERSAFESMEHLGRAWSIDSIRREDPITLTSYFLEQKTPIDPGILHHAINIILHITAAILLMQVLRSLKFQGAFAASFVFAIHPAVLQTVFWAGYRSELIALVLILSALLPGIRNRGLKDFTILLILSTVGYFIHPATLVLPFILGFAIFYSGGTALKNYNRLVPLFCLALFIGTWTQGDSSGPDFDWQAGMNIVLQNFSFHLKQALLPGELSLFYPFEELSESRSVSKKYFLPVLFMLFFWLLMVFNTKKRWARGILLGFSTYLLLMSHSIFEIGAFLDGTPAYEDHFLYISLPIIPALVLCISKGISNKMKKGGRLLWHFGVTILLISQVLMTSSLAIAAGEQSQLWRDMSKKWPKALQPKLALIELARNQDEGNKLLKPQKMIQMLESILEQEPDRLQERILLARIYRDVGQNMNARWQYMWILREFEPGDEILSEAAELYEKIGFIWDATNARERMTDSNTNQQSGP